MDSSASKICALTAAGNAASLRLLLEEDSSKSLAANSTDRYGVNCLTIACCMGFIECVELLLEHRADANALCSEFGPAPLHTACQERQPQIVSRLLAAAANPQLVLSGKSPLQVALERGSLESVQLLEEAIAKVSGPEPSPAAQKHLLQPQHGEIIESVAAVCDAVCDGDAAVLRTLLSRLAAAQVDALDDDGRHGLSYACMFGHLPCVQLLLEHGATVDLPCASGQIALSGACLAGHLDCVEALLSAKATVDQRCELGTTALHGSAAQGHSTCTSCLLEAKANFTLTDDYGATAVHYAAAEGRADCLTLLLDAGADPVQKAGDSQQTPLGMARNRGHTSCVTLLQAATVEAARKRSEAAANELLRDERMQQAADAQLAAADASSNLEAIRAALEECAGTASEAALTRARETRDRLKRRHRKAANKEKAMKASEATRLPTPSESVVDSSSAAAVAAVAAVAAASPPATSPAASSPKPVPDQFLCPITCDIMSDPVITADGQTYERAAIEEWLERHTTSPSTGAPLPHRVLTPSIAIRQLIAEYRAVGQPGNRETC